jgi:hypothetical protein
MFHALTHKQAQQLHPKEYKELKSKSRSVKPFSMLKIGYELCELIQSDRGTFSFADMLAGKAPAEDSIEDKLQRFRKNAMASLCAGRASVPLQDIPEVLIDQRRKNLEKDETERTRFKSLTPEQQDQETQDLLRQLAGPGFMAFAPDKKTREMCKKAGVKTIGGF